MRFLILSLIAISLFSCSEGTDYCQGPQELNGINEITNNYGGDESKIKVELDIILDYGQEIHETTTAFAFSVPDIFVRTKGEEREYDVVTNPSYIYTIKEGVVLPDSVPISAYAFNDCEKTDIVTAYIHFN